MYIKQKIWFLILFDIGSLMMIPCGLTHVVIFNVILKFEYPEHCDFF